MNAKSATTLPGCTIQANQRNVERLRHWLTPARAVLVGPADQSALATQYTRF
jgi:hypothetical protein